MTQHKHIAVLLHAGTLHRDLRCSVVFHLAEHWRAAGHKVSFLRGTRRYVPADLLFVHVNLSVVPEEYLELAARYPLAVNHRARDIRKSRISEHVVSKDDDWSGPVIVKTDLNYGGEPERKLVGSGTFRWARAASVLARLAHRWRGRPEPYRIYENMSLVPAELWDDPDFVVERFLPETEDGCFQLRLYQFLGDRSMCRRITAVDPIIKSGSTVRTEQIEPHPIVETWRERLGLDYGKIDYVVHDGTPILLDANKTTGVHAVFSPEREARRRHIAQGIESFFR